MAVATEKTTVAVKSNAKAVDLSVVSTSKSSKATKEYEKAVNDLAKSMDKLESRHLKANEQITDGIRGWTSLSSPPTATLMTLSSRCHF